MTLKSLLELQSKSGDLEPEQERDISETVPRNGGGWGHDPSKYKSCVLKSPESPVCLG